MENRKPTMMAGSRYVYQQKHQARRDRRRNRRYFLCALLILAVSPSFLALYFSSNKRHVHADEEEENFPPGRRQDVLDKADTGVGAGDPKFEQQLSRIDASMMIDNGTDFLCEGEIGKPCCARWEEIDTDEWWLFHPEFDAGPQNETHTCFVRIQNEERLLFTTKLHELQWKGDCSNGVQKQQISSGYSAALMTVARSFYAAFQQQKPFQITKRHERATWNFSPRNKTHWAYCETEDMNCYFLPLGRCKAELGRDDGEKGIKPSAGRQRSEFLWLRQYAFRPRQKLRRHLAAFQKATVPSTMRVPCAAIHVRRGDISFGKGRRYAAVEEYLHAGNITKGETVVVLTDDVSTIDEINKYLKSDYNWIFLDRPRNRGSMGGFEGFIPSNDQAFEVMSIMTELELAAQCNKLIHGKSGFVASITDAMETSGHSFQTIYLQTQQDKGSQPKLEPQARAEKYLKAIEEWYERKKEYTRVS